MLVRLKFPRWLQERVRRLLPDQRPQGGKPTEADLVELEDSVSVRLRGLRSSALATLEYLIDRARFHNKRQAARNKHQPKGEARIARNKTMTAMFIIHRPPPGSTQIYPSHPVAVIVKLPATTKDEFPCPVCETVYEVDIDRGGEWQHELFDLSPVIPGSISCVCHCQGELRG